MPGSCLNGGRRLRGSTPSPSSSKSIEAWSMSRSLSSMCGDGWSSSSLTGAYSQIFGTPAVTIVYATTGTTPEYREARRRAMSAWTKEVLQELDKENWASVFLFGSLEPDTIYETPLFDGAMWYQPGSKTPISLFPPS